MWVSSGLRCAIVLTSIPEAERSFVMVPIERAAELEAIETAARGLFEGDHGDGEELWVDRAAGDRLMELLGVE